MSKSQVPDLTITWNITPARWAGASSERIGATIAALILNGDHRIVEVRATRTDLLVIQKVPDDITPAWMAQQRERLGRLAEEIKEPS